MEAILTCLKTLTKVCQNISMRQLSIMQTLDEVNGEFPSLYKDTIIVAKEDVLLLGEIETQCDVVRNVLTGLNNNKEDIQ